MNDSILPPIEYQLYLARKLGWSLSDIGKLRDPKVFYAILNEVSFQESVDEWRKMHMVASILAAIYNTIPRKRGSKVLKASDFLSGEMPSRNKPEGLEQLASKHNVKLPTKEIKNRGE